MQRELNNDATAVEPRAIEREQLDDVLDGLRSFIRAEVVPLQRALGGGSDRRRIYEESGRFTPEVLNAYRHVREASAEAGYYTMLTPESIGGSGLGFEALFRVWELIYNECGSEYWLGYQAVSHWVRGPSHLFEQASPTVRESILPPLLDGSASACFAMSEPDAGSDVWMMRTRAVRVDGGWQRSGTKQWLSNGPYADYAYVFAVTNRELLASHRGGVTAFIVPTTTPGFEIDSIIEMFGHQGGDEAIISLSDVFVPDTHVIGEVDMGLPLAMSGVSYGRLYNTARSVGLAQWALDKALAYAEQRITFGRPIVENQGVSFPLADSAMEIHAARLVGMDCARLLDEGHEGQRELSMAKTYATEMAVRVVDRAMQVHGGMGFTNEVGLAEVWQQVRRICIADGSSEILRRQIVKHLRRAIPR